MRPFSGRPLFKGPTQLAYGTVSFKVRDKSDEQQELAERAPKQDQDDQQNLFKILMVGFIPHIRIFLSGRGLTSSQRSLESCENSGRFCDFQGCSSKVAIIFAKSSSTLFHWVDIPVGVTLLHQSDAKMSAKDLAQAGLEPANACFPCSQCFRCATGHPLP